MACPAKETTARSKQKTICYFRNTKHYYVKGKASEKKRTIELSTECLGAQA